MFICQPLLGYAAGFVTSADTTHLTLRELGRVVRLSARNPFWMESRAASITSCRTSLLMAIRRILFIGSKKEVGWILAQRSVAVMADAQVSLYRANINHPRQTMSADMALPDTHAPVSTTGTVEPYPARSQFRPVGWCRSVLVHLPPKAFLDFGRYLWQKVASRFRIHSAVWVRALGPLTRSERSLYIHDAL